MTLTRDQVVDLLSLIVAHDGRNPSESDVAMWAEHAELGRWSWLEARDAVVNHFHNSDAWLMPSHVTAIIKGRRDEQQSRRQLEPNPTGPPAEQDRVRAIVGELAEQYGWQPKLTSALSVRCPHCHAEPGYPCTRPARGGGTTAKAAHPSRRTHAEQHEG